MKRVLLAVMLWGCGDKDTAGDSGAAASDTGAGDTAASDTVSLGDPPASGALVAVLDVNGIESTLVCEGDVVYGYDGFWEFNNLLHEGCSSEDASLLLGIRGFPAETMSSYPGGTAEMEVQTDNPGNRVYASQASVFSVETVSYDAASGSLVATALLTWPGSSLRLWVDTATR